MFIGKQPVKRIRNSKASAKTPVVVPRASAGGKVVKRKAQDVQDGNNAFALTAFKSKTTITKAVVTKVNAPKVTGVSACLRCKILCCCLT